MIYEWFRDCGINVVGLHSLQGHLLDTMRRKLQVKKRFPFLLYRQWMAVYILMCGAKRDKQSSPAMSWGFSEVLCQSHNGAVTALPFCCPISLCPIDSALWKCHCVCKNAHHYLENQCCFSKRHGKNSMPLRWLFLYTHKSRENVCDFIHFKTTLFAAIINDRSVIAFLKLIGYNDIHKT